MTSRQRPSKDSQAMMTVARNRWDEATRVTDAYKVQLAVRTRRAHESYGQPAELQAWADVADCETQLAAAEAIEVAASQAVSRMERSR